MSNDKPRLLQLPSIGRIVVFYAHGSYDGKYPAGVECAAIVTSVKEPTNPLSPVSLRIFTENGDWINKEVPFGKKPGHWSWPTYVAPVEAPAGPDTVWHLPD